MCRKISFKNVVLNKTASTDAQMSPEEGVFCEDVSDDEMEKGKEEGSEHPTIRRLKALWHIQSALDVINVGSDVYVVCFASMVEFFCYTLAVWVRFPNLPIEYYDELFFMKAGRLIGKPLRVDAITLEASRGRRYGHRRDNCPHIPQKVLKLIPQQEKNVRRRGKVAIEGKLVEKGNPSKSRPSFKGQGSRFFILNKFFKEENVDQALNGAKSTPQVWQEKPLNLTKHSMLKEKFIARDGESSAKPTNLSNKDHDDDHMELTSCSEEEEEEEEGFIEEDNDHGVAENDIMDVTMNLSLYGVVPQPPNN
ncbi:hypothetical protein PTKIN_Ptkin01aG0074000 [Pterospermum kingtungense]